MSSPFVAEIRIFPFNFAPRGWAFCNGQVLDISQNTALFSLLGTSYGGNGTTKFALPNLQGAIPMFWGQGTGLSAHSLGETGGSTTVTLLESEIPVHNHLLMASGDLADNNVPTGNTLATPLGRGNALYNAALSPAVTMNTVALAPTGSGFPHNNLMPYLTLNFCIALQGIYPPRT